MSALAHATCAAPGFDAEKRAVRYTAQREIAEAKRVQAQTGCTWTEALRIAHNQPPRRTEVTYHNYIAIVGRMHGDDEDQVRMYAHMTVVNARQMFINDLREDDQIPEADVVAEYEYTNVYITYVLTSASPINLEEN